MKKIKKIVVFLFIFIMLLWACSTGIQVVARKMTGSSGSIININKNTTIFFIFFKLTSLYALQLPTEA